jgi:hypothetical protein
MNARENKKGKNMYGSDSLKLNAKKKKKLFEISKIYQPTTQQHILFTPFPTLVALLDHSPSKLKFQTFVYKSN